MIYRCVFKHGERVLFAEGPRLSCFTSGFWIDRTLRLTETNGDKWIPPHKIEYIERTTSSYPYGGGEGPGPGLPPGVPTR